MEKCNSMVIFELDNFEVIIGFLGIFVSASASVSYNCAMINFSYWTALKFKVALKCLNFVSFTYYLNIIQHIFLLQNKIKTQTFNNLRNSHISHIFPHTLLYRGHILINLFTHTHIHISDIPQL